PAMSSVWWKVATTSSLSGEWCRSRPARGPRWSITVGFSAPMRRWNPDKFSGRHKFPAAIVVNEHELWCASHMTSVTSREIRAREAAVAGVLDAWVRAARAFAAAGVYPVDTGIPGVRLERPAYTMLRELDQHGPRRLGDLALASNLGVS